MTELATNVLSYRDNLDILRRYLAHASADLIYQGRVPDPPLARERDLR